MTYIYVIRQLKVKYRCGGRASPLLNEATLSDDLRGMEIWLHLFIILTVGGD